MSVVDDISDTAYLEAEVRRLRDLAFQEEADAHKHRAKADALELEIVERRTVANIIREVGLTVDRDPTGVPRVKVERTIADPA